MPLGCVFAGCLVRCFAWASPSVTTSAMKPATDAASVSQMTQLFRMGSSRCMGEKQTGRTG
jgi:hypothetical protein